MDIVFFVVCKIYLFFGFIGSISCGFRQLK